MDGLQDVNKIDLSVSVKGAPPPGSTNTATDENTAPCDGCGKPNPATFVVPDCNQMRRKLSNLVNNGGMKVGELTRELGVSGKSYRNFMTMSGKDKGDSATRFNRRSISSPSGRCKA